MWKDGTRSVPVAVKLLKEGASEIDKVKFLQEAAIMAQFKHPNVVSLYGVVSKDQSVHSKNKWITLIQFGLPQFAASTTHVYLSWPVTVSHHSSHNPVD